MDKTIDEIITENIHSMLKDPELVMGKSLEDIMEQVVYDILYDKVQDDLEHINEFEQIIPDNVIVIDKEHNVLLLGTQDQCMNYWLNNLDQPYSVYTIVYDMEGNYKLDKLIIS